MFLLVQGVHVKVVSERAGHANVGITLGIYAHLVPGLGDGAAAFVDASLGAALEDWAHELQFRLQLGTCTNYVPIRPTLSR